MISVNYPTGTATRIQIRDVGHNVRLSLPYYSFQDRYEESAWQRYATNRMKGRHSFDSISDFLKTVRTNRMSDETRKLVQMRRDRRGIIQPRSLMDRIRDKPLTPETFKYERAVGIEIECIKQASRDVSLPLWVKSSGDGSIRTHGQTEGIEYKLLLKRSELEMRLNRFCAMISDHKVNTSCGLHVHIDCRGRTADDVRAVAKRMTAWLIALKEFVPESRRNNTDYAALSFSETNRYRAVNFVAFSKYKTLEIRLHSGTVDYTKIIAWVRLCELLFVLPTKPKAGAQGVAALSQLPLPEYERSYWLKRHAQLNPRQYTSTTPSAEIE